MDTEKIFLMLFIVATAVAIAARRIRVPFTVALVITGVVDVLRTRYRREEAESFGDRDRSERATEEIEALGAELERAFGLGGRDRRVGAASERARTNVQRRIAHALDQLRAASPRLGEHLTAAIRTGTYCVYEVGRGPRASTKGASF